MKTNRRFIFLNQPFILAERRFGERQQETHIANRCAFALDRVSN